MTHADLVVKAVKWLRTHRACTIAIAEPNIQGASESPDALGWGFDGRSVLVECKTSRADFRAESQKMFRRLGKPGMGRERWYMAPLGLINHSEVPNGYGLLEVQPNGKIIAFYDGKRLENAGRGSWKPKRWQPDERNTEGEVAILVSILRQSHSQEYCDRRLLFVDSVEKAPTAKS